MTTAAYEPLSVAETERAAALALATGALGTRPRFVWSALVEPDKSRGPASGLPSPRRVLSVVIDRADGVTYEVEVDLTADRVDRVEARPGRHAPILFEEWLEGRRVLDDPAVVDALARRGVTDLGDVEVEPWPAGNFGTEFDGSGRRLARCVFFVRADDGDTDWARPIDQLVVLADRGTGEVLAVEEGEVLPVVTDSGRMGEDDHPQRDDLRPLHITQPDGPSFQVDGNEISWQRWRMTVSVHPIDGLVLHEVGYFDPDAGRVRPIMHRAALAEMAVPYGDPSIANHWRHVFDAGEVGMGKNACSLTLGCDCLGEIRYLDAVMVEPDGSARTIENAVCLHEEDDGVLWRHLDWKADRSHVRRSRRFVVSSWANLGNYDYGFFWYFYQDGSIELECKLTGVPLATSASPTPRPNVEPIADGLVGPVHQHLFCFRLDLDIDGVNNTVEEVDIETEPMSAANPTGSGFRPTHRTIGSELEGRCVAEPLRGRRWRVSNPSVTNRYGRPVSYELLPTSPTPQLHAHPDSAVAARIAFAKHHLWVTPHDPTELHAAGDYPNQSPGDDGLSVWTEVDRNVENTDVVLWYTCGVTHVARPEDWPVMPVDKVGFHLKPVGFFDRSPALDVPPQHLIQPAVCDAGDAPLDRA